MPRSGWPIHCQTTCDKVACSVSPDKASMVQAFNVFNDALTAAGYKEKNHFDHPGGHPSIDYLHTTGQVVTAMYGGDVAEIKDIESLKSPPFISYKNMTVRSGTQWHGKLGFKIEYVHLESYSVPEGDIVKKGQVIGCSGNTGADDFLHLHVELPAFASKGQVTGRVLSTNPGKKGVGLFPFATAAERIRGSMNFACFLPADNDDVPAITHALLNRGTSGCAGGISVFDRIVGIPDLSPCIPPSLETITAGGSFCIRTGIRTARLELRDLGREDQ